MHVIQSANDRVVLYQRGVQSQSIYHMTLSFHISKQTVVSSNIVKVVLYSTSQIIESIAKGFSLLFFVCYYGSPFQDLSFFKLR